MNSVSIPIKYARNPIYKLRQPTPVNLVQNSIMQLIQDKHEASLYQARLLAQQKVTPTVLTDPLLNLKVREYYREKYERSLGMELVGRTVGAAEGAALGAGLVKAASYILAGVALVASAATPDAGTLAAGGVTLASKIASGASTAAAALSSPTATAIGAGVGGGLGFLTADYTTAYATQRLFQNTFVDSFKQGLGSGILNSLATTGKSMDLIMGGEAIRATLYSFIKGEDVWENIKKAYGWSEDGRTEFDFSKVREATGLDFGNGFINGVFDFTGEIVTDPGAFSGLIGKAKAGKMVNKQYVESIETFNKSMKFGIKEDVITKGSFSNSLAKALIDDDYDNFVKILYDKAVIPESDIVTKKFYDEIRKSVVKTTSSKIYTTFKQIDDFDDWLTFKLIKSTFGPGFAFSGINKIYSKVVNSISNNDSIKFLDKFQGNQRERTILGDLFSKAKEKYNNAKTAYNFFEKNVKPILDSSDETTAKLFKEKEIHNMYGLVKKGQSDPELKPILDKMKAAKESEINSVIEELNKLASSGSEFDEKAYDEIFNKYANLQKELNFLNFGDVELEFYSSLKHIRNLFDLTKGVRDKLNSNQEKLLNASVNEILELVKKDPERVAKFIKGTGIEKFVSFIGDTMNKAFLDEITNYYNKTVADYTSYAEEMSPKYAKEVYDSYKKFLQDADDGSEYLKELEEKVPGKDLLEKLQVLKNLISKYEAKHRGTQILVSDIIKDITKTNSLKLTAVLEANTMAKIFNNEFKGTTVKNFIIEADDYKWAFANVKLHDVIVDMFSKTNNTSYKHITKILNNIFSEVFHSTAITTKAYRVITNLKSTMKSIYSTGATKGNWIIQPDKITVKKIFSTPKFYSKLKNKFGDNVKFELNPDMGLDNVDDKLVDYLLNNAGGIDDVYKRVEKLRGYVKKYDYSVESLVKTTYNIVSAEVIKNNISTVQYLMKKKYISEKLGKRIVKNNKDILEFFDSKSLNNFFSDYYTKGILEESKLNELLNRIQDIEREQFSLSMYTLRYNPNFEKMMEDIELKLSRLTEDKNKLINELNELKNPVLNKYVPTDKDFEEYSNIPDDKDSALKFLKDELDNIQKEISRLEEYKYSNQIIIDNKNWLQNKQGKSPSLTTQELITYNKELYKRVNKEIYVIESSKGIDPNIKADIYNTKYENEYNKELADNINKQNQINKRVENIDKAMAKYIDEKNTIISIQEGATSVIDNMQKYNSKFDLNQFANSYLRSYKKQIKDILSKLDEASDFNSTDFIIKNAGIFYRLKSILSDIRGLSKIFDGRLTDFHESYIEVLDNLVTKLTDTEFTHDSLYEVYKVIRNDIDLLDDVMDNVGELNNWGISIKLEDIEIHEGEISFFSDSYFMSDYLKEQITKLLTASPDNITDILRKIDINKFEFEDNLSGIGQRITNLINSYKSESADIVTKFRKNFKYDISSKLDVSSIIRKSKNINIIRQQNIKDTTFQFVDVETDSKRNIVSLAVRKVWYDKTSNTWKYDTAKEWYIDDKSFSELGYSFNDDINKLYKGGAQSHYDSIRKAKPDRVMPPQQFLKEFEESISEGDVLVAHNANFDFNEVLYNPEKPFILQGDYTVMDSLYLYRYTNIFTNIKNYKNRSLGQALPNVGFISKDLDGNIIQDTSKGAKYVIEERMVVDEEGIRNTEYYLNGNPLHDADVDTELSSLVFTYALQTLDTGYTKMDFFENMSEAYKRELPRRINKEEFDIFVEQFNKYCSDNGIAPNDWLVNIIHSTFNNKLSTYDDFRDALNDLYDWIMRSKDFSNVGKKTLVKHIIYKDAILQEQLLKELDEFNNIKGIRQDVLGQWHDAYSDNLMKQNLYSQKRYNKAKEGKYTITSQKTKDMYREYSSLKEKEYLEYIDNLNKKYKSIQQRLKDNTIEKYEEVIGRLDTKSGIDSELYSIVSNAYNYLNEIYMKYISETEATQKLLSNKNSVYKMMNRNYINLYTIENYLTNDTVTNFRDAVLGNIDRLKLKKQDNYVVLSEIINRVINSEEGQVFQDLRDMFIEIDEGIDFYKSALRTIENDPYYLDIFNNFMNIAEVNYIKNKNVEEIRQLIRNKKYVAIKYYKGDSLKTLQELEDIVMERVDDALVKGRNRLVLQPTAKVQGLVHYGLKGTIASELSKIADESLDKPELKALAKSINSDINEFLGELRNQLKVWKKENLDNRLNPIPFENIRDGIEVTELDEFGNVVENTKTKLYPNELPRYNSVHTIKYSNALRTEMSNKHIQNEIMSTYNLYKPFEETPGTARDIYMSLQSETQVGRIFNIIAQVVGMKSKDLLYNFSKYKMEYSDLYKYLWEGLTKGTVPLPDYVDAKAVEQFRYTLMTLNETGMPYITDIEKLKEMYITCFIDNVYFKNMYKATDTNILGKHFSSAKKTYFHFTKLDEASKRFDDFRKFYVGQDGTPNVKAFREFLHKHREYRLAYYDYDTNTIKALSPDSKDNILSQVLIGDNNMKFSLIGKSEFFQLSKRINPNELVDNSKKVWKFFRNGVLEREMSYNEVMTEEGQKILKEYSTTEGLNYNDVLPFRYQFVKYLKDFFLVPTKLASLTLSMPFIVQNAITAAVQNIRQTGMYLNPVSFMKSLGEVWKNYYTHKNLFNTLMDDTMIGYLSEHNIQWINAIKDKEFMRKFTEYAESSMSEVEFNLYKDRLDIIKNALDNIEDWSGINKIEKYVNTAAAKGETAQLQENLTINRIKKEQREKLDPKSDDYYITNPKPNGKFSSLKEELDDLTKKSKRTSKESHRIRELRKMINNQKYEKFYGTLFNKSFVKGFFDMNEDLEHIMRIQLIDELIKEGFTEEYALAKTIDTHFIYDNKSVYEQYAEFIIPFISYPIRAMQQLDELASDSSFMEMVYLWDKLTWSEDDEQSKRSSYLTNRRSRGDIPVGDKLLQLGGNPFLDTARMLENPLEAFNNKLNPFIKPFVDLATDAENVRWNHLPYLSQMSNLSNIVKEKNLLANYTADFYKRGNYTNYYLPRFNNRQYPQFYNKLYTSNGYSRVAMRMANVTDNNLKYRVNSILKGYTY